MYGTNAMWIIAAKRKFRTVCTVGTYVRTSESAEMCHRPVCMGQIAVGTRPKDVVVFFWRVHGRMVRLDPHGKLRVDFVIGRLTHTSICV